MRREMVGNYSSSVAGGEMVRVFIPASLPPAPPLDMSGARQTLLERATLAVGRLDSITLLLPDPQLFLYAYVRREAVLSSQIEGTQSSLSDLLLFELDEVPGVPFDDVVEVSNYVAALEHGVARLREGFPLCNRLLREMHARLMAQGRGSDKAPGEFRRSQNWIGGTRPGNAAFVPPPPQAVEPCMTALEQFIHGAAGEAPVLLRAALAHVQFETIHPFLDGNGRLGRLLIALLLHQGGALTPWTQKVIFIRPRFICRSRGVRRTRVAAGSYRVRDRMTNRNAVMADHHLLHQQSRNPLTFPHIKRLGLGTQTFEKGRQRLCQA